MEFAWGGVGLFIGVLFGVVLWLIEHGKVNVLRVRHQDSATAFVTLQAEHDRQKMENSALLQESLELEKQVVRSESELNAMAASLQEMKDFAVVSEKQLAERFRLLAQEVLEDKRKSLHSDGSREWSQLMLPMREQLKNFESLVERTQLQDVKDREVLRGEIHRLAEQSHQLSGDANLLSSALRGNNKVQGNWGEMILSRILEESGLREGVEFETQKSCAQDGGGRDIPDVVIHMPDQKNLVVDSKVSLIAYLDACAAESEDDRRAALKRLVVSVRGHIRELGSKAYHKIRKLHSADVVLLCIPNESAFLAAVQEEPKLFEEARRVQLQLVGPSTLMMTVRLVQQSWSQQRRMENVEKIADLGSKMIDKISGFVEDLEDVGSRLAQAQKSHESAMKKLSTGRGSLLKKAYDLQALGIEGKNKLPALELDELEA